MHSHELMLLPITILIMFYQKRPKKHAILKKQKIRNLINRPKQRRSKKQKLSKKLNKPELSPLKILLKDLMASMNSRISEMMKMNKRQKKIKTLVRPKKVWNKMLKKKLKAKGTIIQTLTRKKQL